MASNLKKPIRTKREMVISLILYSLSIFLILQWFWKPQSISVQPVLENTLLMPSEDGLVWKETPQGIVLQEIHNPYVSQLEEGDILLKVDQHPVLFLRSLNEILKTLPPGSVLMYQVRRPAQHNELLQVLVRTFPKSIFKPQTSLFQWIYRVLNLISLLTGILLLLLLYPLLNLIKHIFPLYLATISAILLNLSYLILDLQPIIYQEKTELYFNYAGWIAIFFLLILTAFFLRRNYSKIDFLLDVIPVSIASYYLLYSKNLIAHPTETQVLCSVIFLKSILVRFYYETLYKKNFFFSLLFGAGIGLVLFWPSPYTFGLIWAYWLSFELYTIYQYLKISKVSLVVQQFILIIILISVFSISYSVSSVLAEPFPYDFQNLVRIILSLVISLGVIYLLLTNKNWWKRFLFFSFENRLEKLQKFQISMSQYLNKEQLIEDFKKEIYDFLGGAQTAIYLEMPDNEPYQILIPLLGQGTFWSKLEAFSKIKPNQLPLQALQPIENEWDFIFPLIFSDGRKGLVLIKRTRERYYNLEEVEAIQRSVMQLSLILNLLSLLEKEKILVQKTLEANLTALRSQINPHFLFNTLNTISSLIHDSPDLAEEAVEHLAFIFRYTLKTSTEQFVPLKDEMELVQHYLKIEKIRFGKRLNLEIQVEPDCFEVPVPSLVVQTLVENCIKHGISKRTEAGWIKIHFHMEGDYLMGSIYDNGPGIKLENLQKGTGLNNILTRLKQIYGNRHQIDFQNTGSGTEVVLKLWSHIRKNAYF